MILLNFGQKLNKLNFEQFQAMTGTKIAEQATMPVEYENHQAYLESLRKAFVKLGLTDEFLRGNEIAINPPSGSHAALCVLAEIFRITGKFPMIVRNRPNLYGLMLGSDLSEVIDLEQIINQDK